MLSLILALAENRVIGRDNDLPWHLPRDLKRFKRLTTGHTLVMGRKTWQSIGRPLPKRRSLVLSRDPDFEAPGAEVFPDLDKALAATKADEEVFVIGGASLFAEALPLAQRLLLTRVHGEVEGDVRCPDLALEKFRRVEHSYHPADERHAHAMTFETWDRVEASDSSASGATGEDSAEPSVLTCAEVGFEPLAELLRGLDLMLRRAPDDAEIPGSYWGAPEAGLIGREVWIRGDTPVHSMLHEACHTLCMDSERRARLHTAAGGDALEENAVCYLQILLADRIPGVGGERLMADMDAWGYSFRLGSTRAWHTRDADDARTWLIEHGLLSPEGEPTGRARQE